MIINPSRGDIGMSQLFLHLGNVCLVIQCIRRRSRPKGTRPDPES